MNVKAVGAVWLEKKLLEVRLQLLLSKRSNHLDLLILSVKVVLVSCKLLVPVPREDLLKVLIFLLDVGLDSADVSRKLFICQVRHLFSHLSQMDIHARSNVLAILRRRLD